MFPRLKQTDGMKQYIDNVTFVLFVSFSVLKLISNGIHEFSEIRHIQNFYRR